MYRKELSPYQPASGTEKEQFDSLGYLGPFTLLEQEMIDSTFRKCYDGFPNHFLPNTLARHTVVKGMAELAGHRSIVDKIVPLLGDDLLLWGSQIIRQQQAKKKRFHVDAEFSVIEGVAVWLAVKNVIPRKTLYFISGSHLINTSPQELNKKENLNLYSGAAVLEAARKYNPDCRLVAVDITDGQYVIFHGRLWHGAANPSSEPRYAMNFRYTRPSQKVQISKDGELPDAHWEKERPRCLLVHGRDLYKINKTMKVDQISKVKSLLKGSLYYFPRYLLLKYVNTLKRLLYQNRKTPHYY